MGPGEPGKYEEAAEVSGPSRWGLAVSCVCRAQIVSDHIAPRSCTPFGAFSSRLGSEGVKEVDYVDFTCVDG